MTNKKKMYKYTSIISMAIVLMLIGNLILPMFTLAEGEEDRECSSSCTYTFGDGSTFGMNSTLTRDVDANSQLSDSLTFNMSNTYDGNKPISLQFYWASITQEQIDSEGEKVYTLEQIQEDLNKINNGDENREVLVRKIANFATDYNDENESIDVNSTITKSRQINQVGYYYAIVLAMEKAEEEEQTDEHFCVNVTMIHVENLDYSDPDSVTLQSISVKTEPSKTTYNEGEEIDLSGLVLTAKYSDGREEDVDMSSGKISLNSSATANSANNTVTVAYEGKEASFGITVNKPSEETLTIKANPEKTIYTG